MPPKKAGAAGKKKAPAGKGKSKKGDADLKGYVGLAASNLVAQAFFIFFQLHCVDLPVFTLGRRLLV